MTQDVSSGLVRGVLHLPENPAGVAIVLAHGAGSDSKAKLMVALASAFSAAGVTALRIDLPFRQAGRTPHPSIAARDREGLREAAELLKSHGTVYLGGHSYGGRQATMLAAEDGSVAAGLLLLSYPLHPPGKPDQLRTAHFPELRTPALFLHGTRDPFGSPEEMKEALKQIPGKPDLHLIEKAAHELKPVVTRPAIAVELFAAAYLGGTSAT